MATAFSAKVVGGGEAGVADRVGSIDGGSRAMRALYAKTSYSSVPNDMHWLEDNNPCQAASPAKTHTPGYLEATHKGEYDEGIEDSALCRPYNDRSETFARAVLTGDGIRGIHSACKQYRRSAAPAGVDANALCSQSLTDFGSSRAFNAARAEIEGAAKAAHRNKPITRIGLFKTRAKLDEKISQKSLEC